MSETQSAKVQYEDKLVITGVPPYDGEWPCDLKGFKNRELRRIKQVSGIRAAQLQAALNEGDQDALVALTVVMLERTGKFRFVNEDVLWEADSEAIEFVTAEEQEVAADPTRQTPSESDDKPESESGPDARTPSSGEPSSEKSAVLEVVPPTLPATGTQD